MTSNDLIRPGAGLVFMKVGMHAQESLRDIIARKRREIEEVGHCLWGYGGGTCHPLTMVQPFARDFVKRKGVIYLCMEAMNSQHFAIGRAKEMSVDGITWRSVPHGINVKGSRYALALADIREERFDLPLAGTRVALGNSMGRPGDEYITGHVDKACLEVTATPVPAGSPTRPITLVARIVEPYAVLVRS